LDHIFIDERLCMNSESPSVAVCERDHFSLLVKIDKERTRDHTIPNIVAASKLFSDLVLGNFTFEEVNDPFEQWETIVRRACKIYHELPTSQLENGVALIELFKAKNPLHFFRQCHGLPYKKLVERKGHLKYVELVTSSLAPPQDKKWRRDANG
jgi:hypothetical protein